jgi:TonB family protein
MGRFARMLVFAPLLAGVAFAQVAPLDESDPSVTAKARMDIAAMRGVALDYPPDLLKAGKGGTAVLNLCISEKGVVTSAEFVRSSGESKLDKITLDFAKAAKFVPAQASGAAVAVCGHKLTQEWNPYF